MLNAQATEYKHPQFTLQLSITGVGVDVRLNDIPIEQDDFGGHSVMEYEVNPSIIAGVNELKVIVYPFFDEGPSGIAQTKDYHDEAEVKATLYVNERDDLNDKEILTQIYFRPGLSPEEATKESVIINGIGAPKLDYSLQPISFPNSSDFNQQIVATRQSLPVQNNYPRWAWQDGEIIEDTQENYDSLLAVYREIYDAFDNKDRQKLLQLHAPRSAEYAIAYGLDGGIEGGHAFMNTGGILDHPSARLYEFFTDGVKLDIFANGKMARIIDVAYYHPVVFFDEEKDIVHTMKFGFYKNQQGEWIMIR